MNIKYAPRYLSVVIGGLACLSNAATAGIKEDETILRSHFFCSAVFSDPKLIVYEKEKETSKAFHTEVMNELTKKYSRKDSDTMIIKTSLDAAQMRAAKNPLETCRDIYSLVLHNRAKRGAILSQD